MQVVQGQSFWKRRGNDRLNKYTMLLKSPLYTITPLYTVVTLSRPTTLVQETDDTSNNLKKLQNSFPNSTVAIENLRV
jgi:hypothetical protein